MTWRLRIQPSVGFLVDSFSSLPMVSHLQSTNFRFFYTFDSGHELVGFVEGDRLENSPHLVFNLRSLKAICFDPQGDLLLRFDTVFGQFSTATPEILFSGSHAAEGSLFSFNYRGLDASIYDAARDAWIISSWNPKRWIVEEFTVSTRATSLASSRAQTPWVARASA